jgi:hypothetical protein
MFIYKSVTSKSDGLVRDKLPSFNNWTSTNVKPKKQPPCKMPIAQEPVDLNQILS